MTHLGNFELQLQAICRQIEEKKREFSTTLEHQNECYCEISYADLFNRFEQLSQLAIDLHHLIFNSKHRILNEVFKL